MPIIFLRIKNEFSLAKYRAIEILVVIECGRDKSPKENIFGNLSRFETQDIKTQP
jgi:hypothetical protein